MPIPATLLDTTLANGLRVIILPDHNTPVFTFQVWYKVGSRNEGPGLTGVSHLCEHMMFKGTATVGKGEYSRTIQRHGGNFNAFTTPDLTAYFEHMAIDKLELAIQMEADRMGGAIFDPEEFLSERTVVNEERKLRTDDQPFGTLFEAMAATAFWAHPYRHPVVGWATDISAVTREEAYGYYKRHYCPNNAIAVLVGAVDPQEALVLIKQYFDGIPVGEGAVPLRTVEPPQRGERRVTVYKEQVELPIVLCAYHVPTWTHPDAFPLMVAERVLSDGESSRLHHQLVHEAQMALFAGGFYDADSLDPRWFLFYAKAAPGHEAEELEAALLGEVDKLRTDLIPDREFQKAKNQMIADEVYGRESVAQQAREIAQTALTADLSLYFDYLDRLKAVTPEDCRRVANTYLLSRNCTIATLLDKTLDPSVEPALAEVAA
ncbi:MAG: pitrilysin family protein [bacterium]